MEWVPKTMKGYEQRTTENSFEVSVKVVVERGQKRVSFYDERNNNVFL